VPIRQNVSNAAMRCRVKVDRKETKMFQIRFQNVIKQRRISELGYSASAT